MTRLQVNCQYKPGRFPSLNEINKVKSVIDDSDSDKSTLKLVVKFVNPKWNTNYGEVQYEVNCFQLVTPQNDRAAFYQLSSAEPAGTKNITLLRLKYSFEQAWNKNDLLRTFLELSETSLSEDVYVGCSELQSVGIQKPSIKSISTKEVKKSEESNDFPNAVSTCEQKESKDIHLQQDMVNQDQTNSSTPSQIPSLTSIHNTKDSDSFVDLEFEGQDNSDSEHLGCSGSEDLDHSDFEHIDGSDLQSLESSDLEEQDYSDFEDLDSSDFAQLDCTDSVEHDEIFDARQPFVDISASYKYFGDTDALSAEESLDYLKEHGYGVEGQFNAEIRKEVEKEKEREKESALLKAMKTEWVEGGEDDEEGFESVTVPVENTELQDGNTSVKKSKTKAMVLSGIKKFAKTPSADEETAPIEECEQKLKDAANSTNIKEYGVMVTDSIKTQYDKLDAELELKFEELHKYSDIKLMLVPIGVRGGTAMGQSDSDHAILGVVMRNSVFVIDSQRRLKLSNECYPGVKRYVTGFQGLRDVTNCTRYTAYTGKAIMEMIRGNPKLIDHPKRILRKIIKPTSKDIFPRKHSSIEETSSDKIATEKTLVDD